MSVKKQRALHPCTALLRDSSRCGKYAKAGEPFCAVHRPGYVPTGAAVARPKPISHDERLRRFAESSDPRVAMQAIGILERRRSEGNDTDTRFDARAFLDALMPDEREHVQTLIDELGEIKRAVYARLPHLRPATWSPENSVADGVDVVPAVAPESSGAEHTTAPSKEQNTSATPEDEDDYLVIEP